MARIFQTSDKQEVEKFCTTHNIEWQWHKNGSELTTKQVCQATTMHPKTKEEVWFNQAHLFHISSLTSEDRALLLTELGEDKLPRNAFFGDGSPIDTNVLNHIRAAYDKAEIKFSWQKGDILILDNVLMAHGRMSYVGDRKIVVAMG